MSRVEQSLWRHKLTKFLSHWPTYRARHFNASNPTRQLHHYITTRCQKPPTLRQRRLPVTTPPPPYRVSINPTMLSLLTRRAHKPTVKHSFLIELEPRTCFYDARLLTEPLVERNMQSWLVIFIPHSCSDWVSGLNTAGANLNTLQQYSTLVDWHKARLWWFWIC